MYKDCNSYFENFESDCLRRFFEFDYSKDILRNCNGYVGNFFIFERDNSFFDNEDLGFVRGSVLKKGLSRKEIIVLYGCSGLVDFGIY